MITHISLVTVYVTDQDEARDWYVDTLGFVVGTDATLGDGFRWVTVIQPDHPEVELTLMVPGPPLDPDLAAAVTNALAKGTMGGIGIATDDGHASYAALVAKGVHFVQPPADRPYGIEAVLRDSSGNWLVMVENKSYQGGDFSHG